MPAHNADDIERAAKAIRDVGLNDALAGNRDMAEAALNAVSDGIAARALTDAADEWPYRGPVVIGANVAPGWLRARAAEL